MPPGVMHKLCSTVYKSIDIDLYHVMLVCHEADQIPHTGLFWKSVVSLVYTDKVPVHMCAFKSQGVG